MKKPPIEKPEDAQQVLLHACCAPCSSAIVEWMMANGVRPTIFYFNPNIYPREEYEIRKEESKRHAESWGCNGLMATTTTNNGGRQSADWKTSPRGGDVAGNASLSDWWRPPEKQRC